MRTKDEYLAVSGNLAFDYEREMTFNLVRLRTILGNPNGKKGILYNLTGSVVLFTMENLDKIIPTGEYRVEYTHSPKFSGLSTYRKVADGRVPILLDVPKREGIRIHVGNWPADVNGCIAVGMDCGQHVVNNSKPAYTILMNHVVKYGFHPMRLVITDVDNIMYYNEDIRTKVEKIWKLTTL